MSKNGFINLCDTCIHEDFGYCALRSVSNIIVETDVVYINTGPVIVKCNFYVRNKNFDEPEYSYGDYLGQGGH
jgi:hypothetical protein